MKAFAVKEYKPLGDLSALQEYYVPKPKAAGKDLLVRIKAVATNPIDYKRLGNLGKNEEKDAGDQRPLIVGWDASGIVEEVGGDAYLFEVGDEVMFAGDFFRPGAFAQYALVDERVVGSKPTNLSFGEAATVPLTSLTAWQGMVDRLKISESSVDNAGKTILVTGGAGGVATAAIDIAKHVLGLTVIGTASREETRTYIKELGADYVVNHHRPLTAQINDLGMKEVDYVFHCVDLTGELFDEFADLVKPFGGIACIWPSATVDLMKLFWKSINFSAELMFTRPPLRNDDSSARQHEILQAVSELIENRVLSSRQQKSMTLTVNNLRAALELQASGKAIGKTSLYWEE